MENIENPILRGFNPDPSICRDGDDYYVVTSTFEYYPGIQIHHSRDLKNWRLIGHVLTGKNHFDLKRCECSGGVWAPQILRHGGYFYVTFAVVRSFGGAITDSPNYFVRSKTIDGPWSDAVFLRSGGFDPSLFFDDDGRCYWVNMQMGEPGGRRFNGVYIQEYSMEERKFAGPMRRIFDGTPIGITEGPHLYKRDGFYYLFCAEGGTGIRHAVTVCQSRNIEGPYEVHPQNPILTTVDAPEDFPFAAAGHGDFVELPDGELYLVHLMRRKFFDANVYPLGRETSIQRLTWEKGGWPRLACGGHLPEIALPKPAALPECKWDQIPEEYDLTKVDLDVNFSFLREAPDESWFVRTPEGLKLKGRESLNSPNEVSAALRRVQSLRFSASTTLKFAPGNYRETAGLLLMYDRMSYCYLHLCGTEETPALRARLMSSVNGKVECEDLALPPEKSGKEVVLSVESDGKKYVFRCDGERFGRGIPCETLGDGASNLSSFTGLFVGMAAEDKSGFGKEAVFTCFAYREK